MLDYQNNNLKLKLRGGNEMISLFFKLIFLCVRSYYYDLVDSKYINSFLIDPVVMMQNTKTCFLFSPFLLFLG